MRFLPSALLTAALLSPIATAASFDVTLLNPPAAPSGDVVLRARSDGSPALAFYSAESEQIIYGTRDAGVWNFEIVADAVVAITEVALAFAPGDEPSVVFGNPSIQRARKDGEIWKITPLVTQSGAARFDFEISPAGDLCLAYADGTALRYYRRAPDGTPYFSFIAATDFGPRSIDLELDSSGAPHVAWWAAFSGNTTDQTWGRSWYAKLSGSNWYASPVAKWAYAPSLALGADELPRVSCFRYNYGQRIFAQTLPTGAWGEIVVDSDYTSNRGIVGSSLLVDSDDTMHLLKRSKFWRRSDAIANTATVDQANTMGREGMVVDGDGNVFAAYRNGSYLRFGELMMADVPPPVIVSFGGPAWIYENQSGTLHWELQDAEGARLDPPGQLFDSVDPPSWQVAPDATTEYTLTAVGLAGSTTAVHTMEVRPHEPVIREFFAYPSEIIATQDVSLRWDTEWADTVEIQPIGLQTDQTSSGKRVNPIETTTYTITATSPYGSATADLTVQVLAPLQIVSFTASHGIVGSADEVQLEWEVVGLGSVEIEDLGPVPQEGSVFVTPGVTRSYTLTATYEDFVETATVDIEVNNDFLNSRFYLSWSPDAVVLEPPVLGVYQNFVVYVLGVSLEGGAVAGVEFGVEFPPGLMLLGSNFYSDRAINIVPPPDFIVGLGLCIILDDVHVLASLNFMAADQQTIDEGDIRLRPAIIPSIPGRVAYATCAYDLNGSELEGPLAQALQGPPLYLSPTRVPVLTAGLKAQWVDGHALLNWTALPTDLVDALEIARSVDGGPFEHLATFRDAEVGERTQWEDAGAPSAATLRYALRASAGEVLLVEEFAKLDPAEDLPARTQFLDAYPNPFNPRTTLRFAASSAGLYELRILNAAGRSLRTLRVYADGPGTVEREWDGLDEMGQQAASGVYFVQLSGADALDQIRIVLLK